MAKLPTIKQIVSGFASKAQLNSNFETLRNAFSNTLSRDGSGPNEMNADIDMNDNDILNVDFLGAKRVRIGKETLTEADLADRAKAVKVYKENYSGDGVKTLFYVPLAPNNSDQMMVYIDGVYQQNSSYTVDFVNRAIIFSEAPPIGVDNIEVVTYLSLDIVNEPEENPAADIVEDMVLEMQNFNYSVEEVKEFLSKRRLFAKVTLKFPAGTIEMGNQSFNINHVDGANISIEGEGKDVTTLRFSNLPSASGWAAIDIRNNYTLGTDFNPGVDKLTLDGNNWDGHSDTNPSTGSGDSSDPMGIKAREGGVIHVGPDVKVRYFARNGIFAFNSSHISAEGTVVEYCGSDAYVAANGSTLKCNDSIADNNWGAGYFADSNGSIWSDRCQARNTKRKANGSAGQGFSAANQGRIFCRDSFSDNNEKQGYLSYNSGEMWADGSTAQINQLDGFLADRGGFILATASVSFNNSESGFVADRFSSIDCTGSSSDNNGNNGIQSVSGSVVVARAMTSVSNNGNHGILARSSGVVDSQGVDTSVVVTGNGNIDVSPLPDTSSGISDSVIYAAN